MDALDLLTSDHNRVRGLFKRFGKAKENDDATLMVRFAEEMRAELEVHTTVEEEIFYPAVNGLNEELHETVEEGIQEHHEVKVLLGELESLRPEDDAWLAKWTVIIENVEHHAGEEETDLFPAVRSATEAQWREDLGLRLDRRKGELGAPTLADRIDLTAQQVKTLATEQQIPGRSKMSSEVLRATVAPG